LLSCSLLTYLYNSNSSYYYYYYYYYHFYRELVMAQIRVQITTMYEHLEIVKQTRVGEQEEKNSW